MASCDVDIMPTEQSRWLRLNGREFSLPLEIAKPCGDMVMIALGGPRSIFAILPSACRNLIFPGLWLLIGSVSAIDAYLTVKFQESLMFLESNPIAIILLQLDAGDPSILIGVKFLGSILALGILAALYLQNRRVGLMVSSGLACFQTGLLYYLLVV